MSLKTRRIFGALAVSLSISFSAISTPAASAQEAVVSTPAATVFGVDTSDITADQILQAQGLIAEMKRSEDMYEYFGALSDVEQRSIIAAVEQNPYLIEPDSPRMRAQSEKLEEEILDKTYDLYMSVLEMMSCINLVNVTSCGLAHQAAGIANREAKARYPSESLIDGKGDAFRHCSWSALMVIRIGEEYAEIIGTNHENLGDGEPEQNEMDLINNATGREIGKRFATTSDDDGALATCASMANIGQLVTL